jgi:hypothetical protein
MMAETLYKYLMKGFGVREPGRSYKQPSNNINICYVYEESIPMLGIRDDSKHDCRPIHCGSIKKILTKDMATKDTMWIHTSMT